LAIFAFWFFVSRTEKPAGLDSVRTEKVEMPNQKNETSNNYQIKEGSDAITRSNAIAYFQKRQKQMEEANQKGLDEWRTSIEFYGKVVDENNDPVSDAPIDLSCNDLSAEGTSFYHKTSGPDGQFTISGIKGKLLTVKVSKEGYYPSRRDTDSFYYSGQNVNFSPDVANPVIFHLRKKGQGTELVTSQKGISPQLGVRVPKDGSPVLVDLLQKQSSQSGQLKISQNKPPMQGATNWSFRLSIPDGGLVENHDEFQFQAPESGYQAVVEYNFTKSTTNWTTQVSKQFYIAFGQPLRYGWLRVEASLAKETVFPTYAFNPNGSQNLEPQ
jgi:hypothetical protein